MLVVQVMSAPQPLTGDELAAIKARADDFPRYGLTGSDRQLIDEDVPRLVAEVERLRAQVERAEHDLAVMRRGAEVLVESAMMQRRAPRK